MIGTPGTAGYTFRYARRIAAANGDEQLLVVIDRPIGFAEFRQGWQTVDYPFTIVQMTLNAKGEGSGQMMGATKLSANSVTGDIAFSTTTCRRNCSRMCDGSKQGKGQKAKGKGKKRGQRVKVERPPLTFSFYPPSLVLPFPSPLPFALCPLPSLSAPSLFFAKGNHRIDRSRASAAIQVATAAVAIMTANTSPKVTGSVGVSPGASPQRASTR